LAADTGTSTLVDGFDAEDVAAAADTATMATRVAPMLAVATILRVSFLTNTRLSEGEEASQARSG
jgi:hypothetical protein